jgi:hypothetical protein
MTINPAFGTFTGATANTVYYASDTTEFASAVAPTPTPGATFTPNPTSTFTATKPAAFLDVFDPLTSFREIKMSRSVFNDDAGFPNSLLFTVSIDPTKITNVPAGSVTLITVTSTFGGSTARIVPISTYDQGTNPGNPTPCNDSNCFQYSKITAGSGFSGVDSYYYGAIFTPPAVGTTTLQTVQIGFYPLDICTGGTLNTTGGGTGNLPGCYSFSSVTGIRGQNFSNISTLYPNPGSPVTMNFVVQLQNVVNQTGAYPIAAPTPTLDSVNFAMNFQVDSPSLQCGPIFGGSLYFPADTQINLNTNGFGFTTLPSSADAPATELIVVGTATPNGATTPLPEVDANYGAIGTTPNAIATHIPLNGNQTFGTFQNSTTTNPIPYDLAFMVRDAAGLVAAPSSQAGVDLNGNAIQVAVPGVYPSSASPVCEISGVETSEIHGFLAKSNCFIATGAFADYDSPPVKLLREFRDERLLTNRLGRKFVHWYYGWSPPAAIWLLHHTWARIPVLLALIPLEILAWLALHPLLALFFPTAIAATVFAFSYRRLKQSRAGA